MVAVSSKDKLKRYPTHQNTILKRGDLERGRAAMAAFPNQENGVASECRKKDLKGGPHRNGRFPRSRWWTGRRGE